MSNLEQRQVYCRAFIQGMKLTHVPKSQQSLERFHQSTFKGNLRGLWLVTANVLVSWCWNLCQVKMFLNLSKTNVIFCSVTFYLYMNGLLKVRALKIGYPVYSRLQATFFYKRCRANLTNHRQQSTRVKVKATDLTESDLFFPIISKKLLKDLTETV